MKNYSVYKSLFVLCFVSFLSLFYCCKSNQITKNQAKVNDLEILERILAQNNYLINIEVAYPFTSAATTQVFNTLFRNTGNNANRVDVRGDGNFIEIKNDTVKGYLSFYGERRQNSGEYGRSSAIQFEEPLEDLSKKIDKDKGKLELEFSANQKGTDNEKYDLSIDIYPNKNVSVFITPVYKTFMRYSGILESVDVKE